MGGGGNSALRANPPVKIGEVKYRWRSDAAAVVLVIIITIVTGTSAPTVCPCVVQLEVRGVMQKVMPP